MIARKFAPSALSRVVSFLFLVLLTGSVHSITVTDVVHMIGGEEIVGTIIERMPGQEYHVETAEGTVVVSESDVDHIEKYSGSSNPLFVLTDIVLLRSGVMIRGTIVEERPGDALTVVAENGSTVTLPAEDIWRVTHEKRIATLPPTPGRRNTRLEAIKRSFAIEIAIRFLGPESSASQDQTDSQLQRVRDELETLEEEQEQEETEQAADDRFIAKLNEEIAQLDSTSIGQINELARRAAVCVADDPEAEREIAKAYVQALSNTSELGELAASLARVDAGVIREMREAQDQQDYAEISAILDGGPIGDGNTSERLTILVQRLPEEDRSALFDEKALQSVGPALLNAVAPFGIGSLNQGDHLGALLATSSFVVGGALVLDSLAAGFFGGTYEMDWIGWTGAAVALVGYGYSIARPFFVAAASNAATRGALGLGGAQ